MYKKFGFWFHYSCAICDEAIAYFLIEKWSAFLWALVLGLFPAFLISMLSRWLLEITFNFSLLHFLTSTSLLIMFLFGVGLPSNIKRRAKLKVKTSKNFVNNVK